jgi:hypothetical protein
MDQKKLKELLESVKSNETSIDEALNKLKKFPYEDLGFAKIDNHRALRRGFPEVIFCQGKTVEQVVKIFSHMNSDYEIILGMRATGEMFNAVKGIREDVNFIKDSGTIIFGKIPEPKINTNVMVISAGTADIPVAEEAAITAEAMGNKVHRIFDAGVAGIHRILDKRDLFADMNVIIVVAGMEGALPGIVGGLVDKPVIAVPTSVGYGSSFNGLSALLTMLNTCVPGIAVVNIDNGFGAGYMASLINKLIEDKK